MTERLRCLNCGFERAGRWCSECGQDGERRLATLRDLTTVVFREVTDLSGPIWRTAWRLITRPGELTREYAEGRFRSQVSPIRIYLFVSAAFFLLAPRLGGGVVRFDEGGEDLRFQFGPLGWDSEFLMLILIPLWGLLLHLLLLDRRGKAEEMFVFSVHYNAFVLSYLMVLAVGANISIALGSPDGAMWILFVGAVGPLVYLTRALRVAFDLQGPRRIVSALILFMCHLVAGQMIHNWIESGSPFG